MDIPVGRNPAYRCRRRELSEEPMRFKDRGVDWGLFEATLHRRVGQVKMGAPAEKACADYTNCLVRTTAECLGEPKPRNFYGYEWWSPRLERLRLLRVRHNKARREWQATRRAGGIAEEEAKARFHLVRSLYRGEMRRAETDYFRQMANSGNEDPWGMAYRASSGRVRPPPGVINGLRLVGGFAGDTASAMRGILETMFPDDNVGADSAYHVQIRGAAACVPSGQDLEPLDRNRIERIIIITK